ncbi:MAG: ATP-binding protein [Oscillochloridaceae bacterium]|nr:ATP-binding protein [Chloroflexaceae bacterium]MDW8389738.1 ATP-binding protein [Oscillochloridaceae bacterium]
MYNDLAAWLQAHRLHLLDNWAARGFGTGNGVASTPTIAALAPAAVAPADLLTALIAAAHGDSAALIEQLRLPAATQSHGGVAASIALARALRQSTIALIDASVSDAAAALALASAVSDLFEQAVFELVETWEEHTRRIIEDREFIAESLEVASAAADKRALQLQSLNIISRQLSSVLEEDAILHLVVNNIHQLTGVAHIAIWQPDAASCPDGPILAVRQAIGVAQARVPEMRLRADHPTDLVARAFRSGTIQFDPLPDPARQEAWLQPGCGALALPMVVGQHVVAVTVLQDPDPLNQLRLQQDLAQGVVGQAAIALQNARLYAEIRTLNADLERRVAERTRQLQEEKDRLATIYQISTEVSSTLDLDTLLNTSLKLLADVTRAEQGAILLIEQPEGDVLVTRAVFGMGDEVDRYVRLPLDSGIAGQVVQTRSGLLISDVSSDERWLAVPGGLAYPPHGAVVAVPLIFQGEVLGVITLAHHQTGFFNEDYLRLLNACAGAIATGVNNANMFQTLSAEYERRSELLRQQRTETSKINAILQSLNDGVIVCDLYGSILAVNAAAAPILQRKFEELLLWNLHDLLERYLGPRIIELPLNELLRHPLTSEGQPRIFTSTMRVGMRVVSLTLGPVLKNTDDTELLGALLVLRDITRETEADRMKTEFIGTMSHELRTPMTAIKGFTQLLLMGNLGPLTPTQREFVTTIYNNTERMINLINDVLDLTKIESGSIELEWRSLHMAEVLSGVIAELKDLIAERGHQLTISLPPGLPLVRSDAHRLHQIVYNLLINAVKYTPRGGQIWVEACEPVIADLPDEVRDQIASDRRYLQVNIRDTGVGISAEDLPRIFDRFYRAENPLKIEAGGTGLGLSLVRPLINLLGGRLWVRSTLGVGSTFAFVLPATDPW